MPVQKVIVPMFRVLLAAAAAATALSACTPAEEADSKEATAPAETASEPRIFAPNGGTAWQAGDPVTPEDVRALIAETSPVEAVAALGAHSDDGRWPTVMRGIALGQAEWLAIVPALEPGTENASFYDLDSALKEALINNAAGTLAIMQGDEDLSVAGRCSIDLFEATPADYAAFYDKATPAVEAVTDPALADKKAACLTILRAREGA